MQINFILSSINDTHYLKRVQEFIDHGYEVKVYGFKRKGLNLPKVNFKIIELGIIDCRNYFSRLSLFNNSIKKIAKEKNEGIFFYSSLDIAIFGRKHIPNPYIYEICDLTELTISNSLIRNILICENKKTINKSISTIVTSEGFIDFYKKANTEKFFLIPNKVSPNCPPAIEEKKSIDTNSINIGFVGVIRFETIYNFIRVAAKKKNVLIHLFGIYSNGDIVSDKIKTLVENNKNIIYHGPFKNPDDLPQIYNQIDLVLSAYPPTPGVIYAEPNKLYEAMYFRCPIIVSKKTFLGKKVERLNVGYVIDATSEESIDNFLSSIDIENYNNKVNSCRSIPQKDCLNINEEFFNRLKKLC